jgi:hypothetical protein
VVEKTPIIVDNKIEWVDAEGMIDAFRNRGGCQPHDHADFNNTSRFIHCRDAETFREIVECEAEGRCDSYAAYTQEELEAKWAAEEEQAKQDKLREMNTWVKAFCKEHSLDAFSMDFIAAALAKVQLDIDRWNSKIEGAYEDGLCIGMGATVETWYDHMDGLKESHCKAACFAGDVIEWIQDELPMLWAQWEAQQATV